MGTKRIFSVFLLFVFVAGLAVDAQSQSALNPRYKWVNPRKNRVWSKLNIVQIPLTAYENQILGPVHTVVYKTYKVADKNGMTRKLADSGRNVYDRFGHLVDQNEYAADGKPKWKCIYKYDDHNKAVLWDFRFPDRNEHDLVSFRYDSHGNQTESIWADEHNHIRSRAKYKYDGNGREIWEGGYDSTGKLKSISNSKYDASGNETEWSDEDADGKIGLKIICKYDKAGNRVTEDSYHSDTGKPYRIVFKYDSKGNELETTSYPPGSSVGGRTTTKYDADGRETESRRFDEAGKLLSKRTITYSGNKELIEENVYNSRGSLDESEGSYSEFTFDEQGNTVRFEDFEMKDGKRVLRKLRVTEYTYY